MKDYIVRGTALEGKVRAFAVDSRSILETLRVRHGTWPTATAALGRTVSAGAMIGSMLKDKQRVTLQVKGDGPLGQIVVDANAAGEIRGYVDNPLVDFPKNAQGKLDVAGAVGREGFLYVIKDLGLKEPYRGSVPIISGELAEDFTYYFASSEQIPSAVALGVLIDRDLSVKASGGYIIQLMPGVPDEEIDEIEQAISKVDSVSKLLEQGMRPEDILREVLPSIQIQETMPISFHCKCSQERIRGIILQLGQEEITSMIEKDGKAEVICHFCNEKYLFSKDDLEAMLKEI